MRDKLRNLGVATALIIAVAGTTVALPDAANARWGGGWHGGGWHGGGWHGGRGLGCCGPRRGNWITAGGSSCSSLLWRLLWIRTLCLRRRIRTLLRCLRWPVRLWRLLHTGPLGLGWLWPPSMEASARLLLMSFDRSQRWGSDKLASGPSA